jgi:aminoglycoside phosphotransferase (APT) family kinase protein
VNPTAATGTPALQKYLGELGDVAGQHTLDAHVLSDYLRRVADAGPIVAIQQFRGGQSNPTYLLRGNDRSFVMRARPRGELLASAHAIDREFRVMRALYGAGFPVPEPIAFCEDRTLIGSEFYLMGFIAGRVFMDNSMPDLTPGERRIAFASSVEALAALHRLEPRQWGLEDFGKPGNYFSRQVSRWSKQYIASQTADIPAMDRLIDALPRLTPPEVEPRIVHGDYSFHNLIYGNAEPRVLAVIDWELCTLGDPVADLMYHAMEWYRPPGIDPRGSLRDRDLAALGIPTLEQYVACYCTLVGRAPIENLGYYKAYNLFRVAAILQGIAARHQQGNASDPSASLQAARVAPLAEAAWMEAMKAGAT